VDFNKGETDFGGIFSLSPDMDPEAAEGSPFPPGFVSLVHSHYAYLLSAPNDVCVSSTALGFGSRYDNGILCKIQLRALKIYTTFDNDGSEPSLLVEVKFTDDDGSSTVVDQTIPYHYNWPVKQGYSFPVIPAPDDVSYTVSLISEDENIPTDWIVEFSDPVVANRWGEEFLQLDLKGRDCGPLNEVSSRHDRRFIYASSSDTFTGPARRGHGACAVGGIMSFLASTNKQPAEYAVDGSMETRWESEFSDPQWLELGMVQEMAFTTVELYWQNAHGKKYDIDISDDGETWETVYSETNGIGGLDVIDLTGNSGRYIRMYGHERGTPWGYSLFDFKVSGNPLSETFQPPKMPLVSCSAIIGQEGKYHV
jgi:hypothetical protein